MIKGRIGRLSRGFVITVAALLWPGTGYAQQETVEYYGLDALGSVRIVFDASGGVSGRMDYLPFGEQLSSSTISNKIYAQLFRDGEAGLDHADARMYQVRTGRFSAPDPVYAGLFDPQVWNRFSYSLNAPLTFVDPEGLLAQNCLNYEYQGKDGIVSGVHCFTGTEYVGPSWSMNSAGDWEYQARGVGRGNRPSTTTVPTTTPPATTPPTPLPPTTEPKEPKPPGEPCQTAPANPPGAPIKAFIEIGHEIRNNYGEPDKLLLFKDMVANKRPLDFKQFEPKGTYEAFGNFTFGAFGAAVGYGQEFLLRGAGWAQGQAGTSRRRWGVWFGSFPYGDDPRDSLMIRRGFQYHQERYVTKTCP